jgi:hypothetical protein
MIFDFKNIAGVRFSETAAIHSQGSDVYVELCSPPDARDRRYIRVPCDSKEEARAMVKQHLKEWAEYERLESMR